MELIIGREAGASRLRISINNQDRFYNPQIEMFARFKMKSSFHKTKRII